MESFSKRNNYSSIEKPITIREDAPIGLREFVVQTLLSLNYSPSELRTVFCRVLRKAPNMDNWSEYPNIAREIQELIEGCDWFKVYDLIEGVYIKIEKKLTFESEINDYFKEAGMGWKMEGGQIKFRGEVVFETDIKKAVNVLANSGMHTARTEIGESINDLSRKPVPPDLTGAVQHAVAALECVTREIVEDRKSTLGSIIARNRNIVPPPLEKAIEGIWGYSSEQGRHLREGGEPGFDEAELLVGLFASISICLVNKSALLKQNSLSYDLTF